MLECVSASKVAVHGDPEPAGADEHAPTNPTLSHGAELVSAFMSQLLWKLRAGEPIVLSVQPEGMAWWI